MLTFRELLFRFIRGSGLSVSGVTRIRYSFGDISNRKRCIEKHITYVQILLLCRWISGSPVPALVLLRSPSQKLKKDTISDRQMDG